MTNDNLNQLSLNLIDVKIALPFFTNGTKSDACIVKLESGLITNAVYCSDEMGDLPDRWVEYSALSDEAFEDISVYEDRVTHWQYANFSDQVDINCWVKFEKAVPAINTNIVLIGDILASQELCTKNLDIYGYDCWAIPPERDNAKRTTFDTIHTSKER